ncbi:uncharacterized protein LOC143836855 [Paroedura picta]|uniref:uncharacterized protein LOC143836855 n=1 Tax=Paroedura picta TaxID=143630 RepID=UPI0040574CF0
MKRILTYTFTAAGRTEKLHAAVHFLTAVKKLAVPLDRNRTRPLQCYEFRQVSDREIEEKIRSVSTEEDVGTVGLTTRVCVQSFADVVMIPSYHPKWQKQEHPAP